MTRPALRMLVIVPVLLIGVALVGLGWPGGSAPPLDLAHGPGTAAGPAAGQHPTTATVSPVVPAARAASQVLPEPPLTTTLPSGHVVPVRAVGTGPHGRLAVPIDIENAGWWRGGSRLGDPFGSTLVAAHIDSRIQGLGPFAELLQVRPGARVVMTSTSLTQTFAVESLRLVPQGNLVDRAWIYAGDGRRRLTLVTCAPPYVAGRGGYQNLAVVIARPVGAPRSRTH